MLQRAAVSGALQCVAGWALASGRQIRIAGRWVLATAICRIISGPGGVASCGGAAVALGRARVAREQEARIGKQVDSRRRGRRRAVAVGTVLAAVLLAAALRVPVLRAMGSYLVAETPLQPAAGIVVLAGGMPFREQEGARLFLAGWAPTIVLVAGAEKERDRALHEVGLASLDEVQNRAQTLERLGVPSTALRVARGAADDTREELCLAATALGGAESPVILVTSPYHTRRVLLTWERLLNGRRPGIVRAAWEERFDRDHWWEQRGPLEQGLHEYMGLVNLWAGFPVPREAGEPPAAGAACGGG